MNFILADCVNFVKEQAESLDLPVKVVEVHPKKPVVIITWTGTDASLPSIFLNSHMDVVPVYEVTILKILLLFSLKKKRCQVIGTMVPH